MKFCSQGQCLSLCRELAEHTPSSSLHISREQSIHKNKYIDIEIRLKFPFMLLSWCSFLWTLLASIFSVGLSVLMYLDSMNTWCSWRLYNEWTILDIKFSMNLRLRSSGMWGHVVYYTDSNVSEESDVSMFRVVEF